MVLTSPRNLAPIVEMDSTETPGESHAVEERLEVVKDLHLHPVSTQFPHPADAIELH
jgi:hypothetical protein